MQASICEGTFWVSQAVFHRKPSKRMKYIVADGKQFTSRISDFKTPPCIHVTLASVRSPFTVGNLVVSSEFLQDTQGRNISTLQMRK